MSGWTASARHHLAALAGPMGALEDQADRLQAWGRHLAGVLQAGGRLLVAGNGGSAAQAQHLTSELVGRYRDERRPFSAISLCAESSSVTALANDYGSDEIFARQVRAHGRTGDVLVVLSTSGRSPNVVAAAGAARQQGLTVWALTGPAPNPLTAASDDALVVDAPETATVQEIHQVVVHLLCEAVEAALDPAPSPPPRREGTRRGPDGRAPQGRVVVVGDALLDRDLDGVVDRLCPDAPVPVVDDPVDRPRPGGAALAAVLAAAAGSEVVLITALSDDGAGRLLARLLNQAGVAVVDLGLDGSTPEKVRVRTGGRPLVRIDHGGRAGAVGEASSAALAALDGAGAVLVSDYGRGVAAVPGLRRALSAIAPCTPVVWDPHPRGPAPVAGVRLATPNASEAARLVPSVDPGLSEVAGLAARARKLAQTWQAVSVALTMGPRGALLAEPDGPPMMVPAPVAVGGDPCGAGDCFAAAAAVALAGGALVSEAVEESVRAASAFVAGGGAGQLRPEAPPPVVGRPPAGGGRPVEATALADDVRGRGGTVVATGGCFDLLHAGHVQMLRQARALGDCLVVLVNSDDSVRRLKGPDRPLQPEVDRVAVLEALDCVDAVVVFDEDTPVQALERLRPQVFAKGGDYAVADLPESRTLARWGGEAVVVPYLAGRSTTHLLEEAMRRAP